jgi:hypothetical protein
VQEGLASREKVFVHERGCGRNNLRPEKEVSSMEKISSCFFWAECGRKCVSVGAFEMKA